MTGVQVRTAEDEHRPGSGPIEADATGIRVETALEVLCQSVAKVVGAAPRTPSRVSVRFGCASLEVEWPAQEVSIPATASSAAVPTLAAVEQPAAATTNQFPVCAPLVGTCYWAPEPGARPFVEIGDLVAANQQVAIVEAMKLMNPIVAPRPGRVVEILVADAESVEYGQPLILLRPSEEE